MSRGAMLLLATALGVGCASPTPEADRVPLCGPLDTLAPLPAACAPDELDRFSSALWDAMRDHARSALVRVELDEASRVRAVCLEEGPGYGSTIARRALAENLDAIRALPAGPACAAGKRIDLNRYAAVEARAQQVTSQCQEQVRISIETHRHRYFDPLNRVSEREFEDCIERMADWIELERPGSMRPWFYVKPEVPDPPGPPASETASRCFRRSRVFEKRAACIESEGWERLEPPER